MRLFVTFLVLATMLFLTSCGEKTTETIPKVAKPYFDPSGGNYETSQTVSILCETLGVTILYTTDGSDPNSSSSVYSEPIMINSTTTLKARAFRTGYQDSDIASVTYTIEFSIQLQTPEFYPGSGEYYSGQEVTSTAPEFGANIHYTVNGSEPTQDSDLYDPEYPLIIPNFFPPGENSVVLKAKAFKDGFEPSETAQAEYDVIFFNTVSTPHISPLAGDITTQTEIEIYCTTLNSVIFYTLDGSDPTQDSILYDEPFTISQTGEVTLKARGFRPNWNPSEIASASYIVSP
jgi:hypothetical protein